MFREKYIKDNELIKPDEDFLRRLKETVSQEEVHIGDYVDYNNSESFEKIGNTDATVIDFQERKNTKKFALKTFAVLAACFVLVCTVVFAVGENGLVGGGGLKAGMESALPEDMSEDVLGLGEEYIDTYNKVCELFATSNVVIYEIASDYQEDEAQDSLEMLKSQSQELDVQAKDKLVRDVLADNYDLSETMEAFDSVAFYMAEFEDQTCVLFATDTKQSIYIIEIFEK